MKLTALLIPFVLGSMYRVSCDCTGHTLSDAGGTGGGTADAGGAGGGTADAGGAGGQAAPAPGCGLPAAAFCDPLDTPHPGGRGGDLDETLWSVTRATNDTNFGQGDYNRIAIATALVCGQTVSGVTPADDYRLCTDAFGTHLTQTADDDGMLVSSFRARQPFDFAGRTGVIAFDLGGSVVGGHGAWPVILIAREPSPAPYQGLAGLSPYPRQAVVIDMNGQPNCGPDYLHNHISSIALIEDFSVTTNISADEMIADYNGTVGYPPCFEVNDTRLSHYEIRISQSSIEVWNTLPGADPTALRLIAKKDGLTLPFTRGYVNFQQVHSEQGKDDPIGVPTGSRTYNWANIGFDGPILPIDRAYDVADAMVPKNGAVNLGYSIDATPTSFTLPGVVLSGASEASLNLSAFVFPAGRALEFRFNGGAWQSFVSQVPAQEDQRSAHVPFPIGLLRDGSNTVELRYTGGGDTVVVSNVDLTLR